MFLTYILCFLLFMYHTDNVTYFYLLLIFISTSMTSRQTSGMLCNFSPVLLRFGDVATKVSRELFDANFR